MVMQSDDDFEEAMRDLDYFSNKLVKIIESELNRLLKDMEDERDEEAPEANRERTECDETSRNDHLNSDKFSDYIGPLKPLRPIPKPRRPLDIPKKALAEMAEPLTDVFDKGTTLEVYVELPGAEKRDVRIKAQDGKVEVKTRNLRKVIELPTGEAVRNATLSDYKNGVLKIVIPKRFELRSDDERSARY